MIFPSLMEPNPALQRTRAPELSLPAVMWSLRNWKEPNRSTAALASRFSSFSISLAGACGQGSQGRFTP